MNLPRLRTVILLSLVAALLLAAGSAVASSGYTVESTTSIDTPSRTVTVQGNEYTVSSLGYRDVGDTIPVEVSRPGDGMFTVYLYNGDGSIMDSVDGSENGTYTLDDTTSLERGTYVLVLEADGSRQTIQPVVMSGYDFAVDAPEEASENERVTVTIELTGDTERPNYVDIAVMNDSTHRYVTTKVGDRTYSVTFDDLAADEYEIYAAARSDEEVNGRDEVTGVSSVETLTITSSGETTTEPTTTESSSGGDSDPSTSDPDDSSGEPSTDTTTTVSTNTTEQTATTPETTTATTTSTVTPDSPNTDGGNSTSTDGSGGDEGEPTSNDSNVIDPSTPTETQPGESDASTPMFPLNVVGALIVSVLLLRRERDR